MWVRRFCFCLAALLLWTVPAYGAGFRVLVRTEDEDGLRLVRRIEGQASDLAVEVAVAPTPRLETTVNAQLGAADLLAAQHDAQVVVWWCRASSEPHPRWRLYILHPGRRRVVVRMLGEGTEHTGVDSAVLEEAALIVRATLQALVVGAQVGVERSLVELPAVAPPKPGPPLAQKPAAPTPHPAVRARVDRVFAVNAGWQMALDGTNPGQQGPTVRVGYLDAPWQAGLMVAASVGGSLDSRSVSIRLARHSAAGWLGIRSAGSRWELAAGLEFGLALFTRSTTGTAPGLTPSSERIYSSWLVGPELSLSFRPLWPRRSWRVAFMVGADYVPGAPELGIDTPQEFRRLDALWRLQPRSGASLGLEF